MPDVIEAEPLELDLSPALSFLPEGPFALAPGRFSWVAIQHGVGETVGSINRCELGGTTNESFDLPGRPGFAFPCENEDRFVVGCERELGFFDVKTMSWEPFCKDVDHDVTNTIINDGIFVGEDLIFGTKDLEFATEKAGLYFYDASESRLVRLRNDQICSNGKAILDQDGEVFLIDIDSPTRKVVRYRIDLEAASIGEPEIVLDLTDDPPFPTERFSRRDGKSLIVAMFLPQAHAFGETRQYDLATGDCQFIWRTPLSPQNTCPALVPFGSTLKLVVTTAVENMTPEDQAVCTNAGKLFVADTEFSANDFPLVRYPG